MKILCLFIFLLFCFHSINANEKFCNSRSDTPYSMVLKSENGKYTLVLLCSRDIDLYVKKNKRDWEKSGLTKKDRDGFIPSFLENIEEEKTLRRKYAQSGLYSSDSGQFLFNAEDMPAEMESIYVSNDGTYVIGYNYMLHRPDMSKPNTEEINQSAESAFFVIHSDRKTCSRPISEFKIGAKNIRVAPDGYIWAKGDVSLDNQNNTLQIIGYNGRNYLLDIKNCKVSGIEMEKAEIKVF